MLAMFFLKNCWTEGDNFFKGILYYLLGFEFYHAKKFWKITDLDSEL